MPDIRLPNGKIIRGVPEGTPKDVIMQKAIASGLATQADFGIQEVVQPTEQPQEAGLGEQVLGGIESALAVGSGALAEPVAGLRGIYAAATGGDPTQVIDETREALTYEPRLPGAQAAVQNIGEAVQPAAQALSEFEGTIGDYVLEKTGSPELAAIAHTLPTATIELLGARAAQSGVKGTKQTGDIAQAQKAATKAVEGAEDATGIRQLTTDVLEPETRAGKFLQQQGELLEGGQRVAQQSERVRAIDKLLGEYDVTDAARFEQDIVEGVKRSVDAKKAELANMYDASTKQLDQLGDVPLNNTKKFASDVIEKESKKGSLADQSLITEMQGYLESPDDLSFETVKSVRSAVGQKLEQARKGAPVQGSSDTAMLSQLYARLSNDMRKFADDVAPDLAKSWKEADKEFSGFATGTNKAGVKRLIKDGNATPEIVDQLLFSTKKSDIDFLKNNLDEAGKGAAKQRVIQQMLQRSSPDGVEINPNRFQTQMNKLRKQTSAFFDGSELKAIDGLRDALNTTRRAQDAAVTTQTGQQLVPLFAITNPTVLVPGVAQAIIERPTMRNLLIRRKAAKTAQARNAIDLELQQLLDEAGLTGAAISGATVTSLEEQ